MVKRKDIFDVMDKLEGKKKGISYNALQKEMVRQGYKQGCPYSYSGEHSFESYGKGKIKCIHCGIIKPIKKPK